MPTGKFLALNERLDAYARAHGHNHDPLVRELIRKTAALAGEAAAMQITPEQGTLLSILVRASGARRAVEIGTFTGLSALCIARALPAGGRLLCCDVSEQWTTVARRFWKRAGIAERIELRLAPALDTLRALPERALFDFAFIDADKTSYPAYYEELVKRLCPNGLIVADNVLWHGQVVDPSDQSAETRALRRFNHRLARDCRVEAVMLTAADGITIARKR